MNSELRATKSTYAGLFMVTLATLMYEILLTRIFSVTMWYHFAFMAISVAMFGMTVGAVIVYLFPRFFLPEKAPYQLGLSAFWFSVSIVFSFLAHLCIPVTMDSGSFFLIRIYSLAMNYAIISLPFIFSGICVSLALTRFHRFIGKLYAADLIGAALGCLMLLIVLKFLDGPTAAFVVAFLAGVGSLFFAIGCNSRTLARMALVCCLGLAVFVGINSDSFRAHKPLVGLLFVKSRVESPPLYEKWNSFSRVRVYGKPDCDMYPFGWGLSTTAPGDFRTRQMMMDIDAAAATPITAFSGCPDSVSFLKYDVVNMAHWIRRDAKVLIVGPGGGRDVLSALVFNQKAVTAVEINEDILATVNRRFGDFSGHLDRNPKVTFINDEARSYIARSPEKQDIIQVSMIDTWAATAAGAFVLSENSLYTTEAWTTFLRRLTPTGILTFSRWYYQSRPGEVYRLASLARASLKAIGVANPRGHILILKKTDIVGGPRADALVADGAATAACYPDGIGTILVSPQPFSAQDCQTIEEKARDLRFDVVLSPNFALDSVYATLASGQNLDRFCAEYPINIASPTDDKPFFFQMLRLRDVFHRELWSQGFMSFNTRAVLILIALLCIVAALSFLCIIVPLLLTARKAALKGSFPLLLYFMAIGFGFMLVEISQMQRLMIFLGHPTYGLSVVLFSLLLSSGLGSYSTQKLLAAGSTRGAMMRLSLLLAILIVFGLLTPGIITSFQGVTTLIRILIAVGILMPLGFLMGMAFPIGMHLASGRSEQLTPWLWGINGATSVFASVLAVAIGLSAGITASFWIGFGCYVGAVASYYRLTRGAFNVDASLRQAG